MTGSIRNRVVVLLTVVVALFIAGLFMLNILEKQKVDRIYGDITKEGAEYYDKVVSLNSKAMENVADYNMSVWSEMQQFLKTRDREFAKENIDFLLGKTYNYSAAYVYDLNLDLIYSNSSIDGPYKEFPLAKEKLKDIFRYSNTPSFFVNTTKGLMEVKAASIHKTGDNARKTPAEGYFLLGKLWDTDYMNGLTDLTGNRTSLAEIAGEDTVESVQKLDNGVIKVFKIIRDYENKPIAKVQITVDSPVAKELLKTSTFYFILYVVFSIILIIILLLSLYGWVTRPLNAVSKSLITEDVTQLQPIKLQHSEFSEIAKLIEGFFIQKKKIEDEVKVRKETQESLKLFSHCIKNSLDAVIICDISGHILYYNETASNLYQYGIDELVNKHISVLNGDEPEVSETVFKSLTEQGGWVGEKFERKKDGSIFPIYMTASLIKNDEGKIIAISGIIRDITTRRKQDKELIDSKVAAEKANRTKSEFLAMMSHEIRTPMNAIIGFTELLLGSKLDKEQADYMKTIRLSGNNLLNIINDILDFSKIESGKFELEDKPFNLIKCVDDVISTLSIRASEKGIKLLRVFGKNTPEIVSSDEVRIRQILMNLVGNSIKFTNRGEVIIKVDADYLFDEKKWQLKFCVIDSGIGIPPDKINKLFKPFSQVDSSNTRKFGGTGLGLVICKRLCELMEGNIWVESIVGKGSVFYFNINAKATDVKTHEAAEKKTNGYQKMDYVFSEKHPLKILLAEDNLINQKLIAKVLERFGYKAEIVSNGQQVLDKIVDTRYDLIITDVQMPVMDGLETTLAIRALPDDEFDNRNLYIVALTASALEEEYNKCFEVGMNDVILKPIDIEKLSDSLSRAYEKIQEYRAEKV